MTDHLWLPAPAGLALSRGEVHIWRVSLDLPGPHVQGLLHTLAPEEVNRAEQFCFAADRDRFIVARGVVRAILGRYLNKPPGQLQFCYGYHGKPALVPGFDERSIDFSVSHSHNLALYAITCNRQIGIDLEYIRPIPEANQLVERFFSARETRDFRAIASDKQLEAFFSYWTLKEAFIKAKGQGFALGLDRFDISVAPGASPRLLNVEGDPWEASRWYLRELSPAPGYEAALAVEGRGLHLSCWEWTE